MNYSVEQLVSIEKYLPSFVPTGFLEIGSFDGTDALLVKEHYKIPAYAIEANVTHFNNRMLTHVDKLNIYCFLASDFNGEQEFYNIISGPIGIQGKSSVFIDNIVYVKHKIKSFVTAKRIDTFLQEENITANFVKIDAEGYAYQVLVGFGERIYDFQAIQVETEQKCLWLGQKTHKNVHNYLEQKGFMLVNRFMNNYQNDCLYIKKEIQHK